MDAVVNDLKPFDLAFKYTIQNEGGWAQVSGDRGGATHFGITMATYSRWLGRPASVAEMKNLDLGVAKKIYEKNYWLPIGCDQFAHTACAMAMFDVGVVRGIAVPPKYAQRVANEHGAKLAVDGHLGPISMKAINDISPANFLHGFHDLVLAGFNSIVESNPGQKKFLAGWTNRASRLLTLIKVKDIQGGPDLSLVKS